MALIECNYFSEVLRLSTSMTVILPQQTKGQIGMENIRLMGKHPTLYLLHGMSDDHTIWIRRTSIERYVAPLGIAVVMPQVHRSSYADMVYGNNYWTFLSEELPELAQSFFPLSKAREDNFVAGLSMGGYGALKWALRRPDRFVAVASLSGGVNRNRFRDDPLRSTDYRLAFGDQSIRGTENDLFTLLRQCDESGVPKPKIYHCCGTEDSNYEDNLLFREACEQNGFETTFKEGPGGHTWDYWDRQIQDVLAWLPIRNG
ncbi:esterase family protein [Paenibacillus doosanensis]|uniref:alpha/beta hydrolase n=1 Tax=Paenibacillus doosanensis TaxID=1229154 RepID=UPI0021805298|nr:alpha/beta hydrolase family protein [Paenibacillus doosanensis]MCS7461441.1 esterase family protein [Paenibacillus doosanensis]